MPRKATQTPKQRLKKISQYNNDYVRKAYDRFSINLPKGYKDTITGRAAELNISVTEYIKQLIDGDLAARRQPDKFQAIAGIERQPDTTDFPTDPDGQINLNL